MEFPLSRSIKCDFEVSMMCNFVMKLYTSPPKANLVEERGSADNVHVTLSYSFVWSLTNLSIEQN